MKVSDRLAKKYKSSQKFWRLKKVLYRLKQAGQQWKKCLYQVMTKLGFICTITNKCLYILWKHSKIILIVLMLCNLSWVDLTAKSLRVIKRTQWDSCLIVPTTYTSMLFALVYINSILQPAKRLPVQFSCLLFYKYISLVIVKATHNTWSMLITLEKGYLELLYSSRICQRILK